MTLQREQHNNSRRKCRECGATFVAVSFGGTKLGNGRVCNRCEVEAMVEASLQRIRQSVHETGDSSG